MNTITLNNGITMPQMGYGVYQVSPAECERCVLDALETGYRLIDTAQAYHNEAGVGAAIARSGLKREEVFLVSKVWISHYGYEKARASVEESLRQLQTGYIDPVLQEIGRTHGKTAAQVALRWLLQRGAIIIPKSTHKERMQQNIDIFDFELAAQEMAAIAGLDTGKSLFFDHHSAEAAKMFMGWR